MDTVDRQNLEILERDARTPLKKIAAAVFLSPPAVSARIERMEQRGVITGYRALVDPQRLGYAITALINIAILPKHQPAFAQFVKGCSNVTECYHVAGTYSMLLKACFATTGQVDSFVESLQRYGKTPDPDRPLHRGGAAGGRAPLVGEDFLRKREKRGCIFIPL